MITIFGVWDDRADLDYRLKFLGQFTAVAIPVFFGDVVIHNIPFGPVEGIPDMIAIPLTVIFIVGTTNAINLSDGLDGLAIGTVGIVGLTLGVISYISGNALLSDYLTIPFIRGNGELAIYCAALAGAALGFLWFNAYPAQVFMGDTGSLALGGAIGALCVLLKKELLLPTLGGIFLAETVSVIVQRLYFKYTKRKYGTGRRVFRMAPLHHHFEMVGWPEPKIVTRFYIVAVLLMILSLATFKVR